MEEGINTPKPNKTGPQNNWLLQLVSLNTGESWGAMGAGVRSWRTTMLC